MRIQRTEICRILNLHDRGCSLRLGTFQLRVIRGEPLESLGHSRKLRTQLLNICVTDRATALGPASMLITNIGYKIRVMLYSGRS